MITIKNRFGKLFQFKLDNPLKLGVSPGRINQGTLAFHVGKPQYEPLRSGSFVGSLSQGGSCNCEVLKLIPHGQGTHTETIGHILETPFYITDYEPIILAIAELICVEPIQTVSGDWVISKSVLLKKVTLKGDALIIKTHNNPENINYSGTNPCYFEPDALTFLAENGYKHLLVDLPSVDREEDGGLLAAHKAWWNFPENPRYDATITELIKVPNTIKEGIYGLIIGLTPLATDAVPTQPLLYNLC